MARGALACGDGQPPSATRPGSPPPLSLFQYRPMWPTGLLQRKPCFRAAQALAHKMRPAQGRVTVACFACSEQTDRSAALLGGCIARRCVETSGAVLLGLCFVSVYITLDHLQSLLFFWFLALSCRRKRKKRVSLFNSDRLFGFYPQSPFPIPPYLLFFLALVFVFLLSEHNAH